MTKLSPSEVPAWLTLLPAGTVLLSWVDWTPPSLVLFGRAGPYWAGALAVAGLTIASLRRILRPAAAVTGDSALRTVVLTAAAVVACWGLAAIAAVDKKGALVETGRVAIVLLFFFGTSALAARDQRVRTALGWAALALVAFQVTLLLAGWASPRVADVVFEHHGQHSHLPVVPRFRGLMIHAMACGSSTLLLAGLLAQLPGRALRAAGMTAAAAIVVASLSFATLALPLAAVMAIPLRRTVRVVSAALLAAAALMTLWLNPLRVQLAGRTVVDRPPLVGYSQEGLGPRHMPIHAVAIPGLRLDFHFTGYALLAARSVSCAGEHPLGVGGRNYIHSCPAPLMNTQGMWGSRRSAHNAYAALLAEGGLLTTIATIGLAVLLIRQFRMRPGTQLEAGVLLAFLLAGFAGASPYQFTFAALFAAATTRQHSDRDSVVSRNT